jgi:hypothetical protein
MQNAFRLAGINAQPKYSNTASQQKKQSVAKKNPIHVFYKTVFHFFDVD